MSGVIPIPHFVAVFFFSLLIITIFFSFLYNPFEPPLRP